jgi:multiple sugar transport system permease protein
MQTRLRALRLSRIGWHLVSIAIAAVFAVPLLFALSLSLRQVDRTLPTSMEWLPNPIVPGNYAQALADGNLIRYGLNSLLVVAVAVPVTLVVSSWAGLAMARSGPAAQRRMVAFCVVALLIPHSMIWLPRFLMVKWAGLIDTPFALMLPALMGTSPLFALLFYWAFRRQPADLFDAAAMDGAGALRVWWSLAFPLVGPTAMAVGALAFLYFWGDYIDPLLMIKSPARYTLPVGLSILQQFDKTRWPLVMAAAVLYAVPSIGVFLAAQRYFLSGRRMLWLT